MTTKALLSVVDGRSASARRHRDLLAAIRQELGNHITPVQAQRAATAAALMVAAESAAAAYLANPASDPMPYLRLVRATNRVLQDLRLPSLTSVPVPGDRDDEFAAYLKSRRRTSPELDAYDALINEGLADDDEDPTNPDQVPREHGGGRVRTKLLETD